MRTQNRPRDETAMHPGLAGGPSGGARLLTPAGSPTYYGTLGGRTAYWQGYNPGWLRTAVSGTRRGMVHGHGLVVHLRRFARPQLRTAACGSPSTASMSCGRTASGIRRNTRAHQPVGSGCQYNYKATGSANVFNLRQAQNINVNEPLAHDVLLRIIGRRPGTSGCAASFYVYARGRVDSPQLPVTATLAHIIGGAVASTRLVPILSERAPRREGPQLVVPAPPLRAPSVVLGRLTTTKRQCENRSSAHGLGNVVKQLAAHVNLCQLPGERCLTRQQSKARA